MLDIEKDTRPTESPYASKICAVYCRDKGPLYINQELLRQSNELFSAAKKADTFSSDPVVILLEDISFHTGHVIVHYLATNTYQCLNPRAGVMEKKTAWEFFTALRVYIAAESLSLNQLRELAREELVRLGDKLELSTLIRVMDRSISSFKPLPDIAAYIESRLLSFYEESPRATADRVLTNIGIPHTLSEVLFRSIVLMKASKRSLVTEPTIQHAAAGRSYTCSRLLSTRQATGNTQVSSNTAQTSGNRLLGQSFGQSDDGTDQSSDVAYPLTPSFSEASSSW